MNLFALLLCLLSPIALAEDAPVLNHISEAIQAHVAEDMNLPIADVEVEWLGLSAAPACEEGAQIWIDTRPGENYRGQTQVRITLTDSGGVCSKMTLASRIHLWQKAPVSADDVEAGDAIEMTYQRVASNRVRGVLVDPEAGPWMATQKLRAGEPVTMRYVRKEPAARVGDSVQLVVSYGILTVKADARMLADAQLGDEVRVSNLATDTVVQGILVAPDTVRTGGGR